MSKISQQDIADQLQISRATVSRCFTNHPGINPETRARVFDLASKSGYVHMEMRAPSRPRRRKQHQIGVIVCTAVDDYLNGRFESPGQKLFAGVSEFALLHEVQLNLHYVDPNAHSLSHPDYQKIKGLNSRKWAGAILIYPFPHPVVADLLPRLPLVSLVEHAEQLPLNCVDVDHYKGIALVLDELNALGHRRIGFFTRSYDVEAAWSLRRFSAFIEKMARLRLPVATNDVINIFPNLLPDLNASYNQAARQTRDGVTAWVCAADHVAYDLIAALEARNLNVPLRVSVTGFDGIRPPDGAPKLSTVVIPYRDIGLIGGKRLIDLAEKRFTSIQHALVTPSLFPGETTAPPHKKFRSTQRSLRKGGQ